MSSFHLIFLFSRKLKISQGDESLKTAYYGPTNQPKKQIRYYRLLKRFQILTLMEANPPKIIIHSKSYKHIFQYPRNILEIYHPLLLKTLITSQNLESFLCAKLQTNG